MYFFYRRFGKRRTTECFKAMRSCQWSSTGDHKNWAHRKYECMISFAGCSSNVMHGSDVKFCRHSMEWYMPLQYRVFPIFMRLNFAITATAPPTWNRTLRLFSQRARKFSVLIIITTMTINNDEIDDGDSGWTEFDEWRRWQRQQHNIAVNKCLFRSYYCRSWRFLRSHGLLIVQNMLQVPLTGSKMWISDAKIIQIHVILSLQAKHNYCKHINRNTVLL